jgi:hypothetical protein
MTRCREIAQEVFNRETLRLAWQESRPFLIIACGGAVIAPPLIKLIEYLHC